MSENETELQLEKKKKGRKPSTLNYFAEREDVSTAMGGSFHRHSRCNCSYR